MSSVDEVKFSLKVMINKNKTKVLFAEVDSDLSDVLLSFLTLPLGTIVRILEKYYGEAAPVLGSLNTLRKGLADLNDAHFSTEEGKQMLLNPVSAFVDECLKLKVNIDQDSQTIKYFTCEDLDCDWHGLSDVRIYYDTARCQCGKRMNREISARETDSEDENNQNGVFARKTVSFAIRDDLQIAPNVTGSILQNIRDFGITDIDAIGGAEQVTMTLGLNEIMDLLKGSLFSKTPLTDLILNKRQTEYLKLEPSILMHKMEETKVKKMVIKVVIHRSTKKLLFAVAKENFIDFLFSLLTIPLGGVINLVGINTPLGSINNLYRSIQNLDGDEYLNTKVTKTMLLDPELPPMYVSKNQIFPLVEKKTPLWYFHPQMDSCNDYFRSIKSYKKDRIVTFNDPKGQESYVKEPGVFMVADDLTVTPLSMLSTVSVLNQLKIPISDVEEVEVEIGLEEALKILRASLTSTSALTNSLTSSRVSLKKPKEEH